MKIVYADDNLALKNSVVVLGNFDGVHSAHKMLIEKAKNVARENNLAMVIYTFSEHPKKFFGSSVEILTTNNEKEKLFELLGADVLVYQKPDKDFLNLSPEKFVENVVVNKLDAKFVVVGKHYTFGAKAMGTSSVLENLNKQYGIKTYVEELLKIDNQVVSSSEIRNYLKNGEISKANEMLGREFSIEGEVVHGNHLGTGIGFPTANINFESNKIVPKYGVYAGKALVDDKEYNSIINIGIKPTVGGENPLLEAHILDVNADFYGKVITFRLLGFLRDERKFEDLTALKKQIDCDLEKAKEYFN